MRRIGLCGLCAWLWLVSLAAAQEKPAVEEIKLSLSPAAEPRPALKYSLWRAPRERQAGNGATFYYRAMLMAQSSRESVQKDFPPERVEKWSTTPISELPVKDIGAYLDLHKTALEQLHIATSRERCEWDLRLDRLRGEDVVSFLLPDFQSMRDLGRLVACKARYEIAQGRFEDAILTLRMGYQMAHDCAEPPLLINALIGIAIAAQMHAVTLDFIDAPDSPNLYWALKQLPHPLVDIRPAMQFELAMPYQMFPFLADAETAERSPQEWQRMTQEALSSLATFANSEGQAMKEWQLRLGTTAVLLAAYPAAKRQLIEQGMAEEVVERMPVGQVIAIQTARTYRHTYHEVFKWTLLPYEESHLHMQQALERLKQEGYLGSGLRGKEVLPIASLLMPSIELVTITSARSERRLAALETLEAIRLHAAARQGELPSSLDELAVAPASKNPFTNQYFAWQRDAARATLEERAPGVNSAQAQERIYLIELTKTVK